jgi:phenylacetate-CoA ligase
MHPEIHESLRFPLLSPAGRRWLHTLRQHPRAPRWNWPNGEQLNARGLERVQDFAKSLGKCPSPIPGQLPDWVPAFTDYCCAEVPFYRRRAAT